MEYEGLTRDDLANVRALNRAWLRCRGGGDVVAQSLTARRLERLAAAPCLLFSLREQDDSWWNGLLEDRAQRDLLREPPRSNGGLRELQSTGLAFLWGLARRNPYAVRIVSGAPSHWCEQIASATLMQLLDRSSCCDLIQPRFENISKMHKSFAQIGALQSMLTTGQPARAGRLAAAACSMPDITRQVADKV